MVEEEEKRVSSFSLCGTVRKETRESVPFFPRDGRGRLTVKDKEALGN